MNNNLAERIKEEIKDKPNYYGNHIKRIERFIKK